jgi:hypothetical protein
LRHSSLRKMSNDQQLEKLKGHVLIFSEEFRDLIQGFQMLLPIAEPGAVLNRFSGTKQARGLLVIRWSLMQECTIGITKLAYDHGSQNPTAGRLIENLFSLPKDVREKLRDAFSVPIRAVLASDREETEQDLKIWLDIEQLEIQELRQAFDEYLPQLETEWDWLSQHKEAFKDLRDRRLAHLDVSLIGDEYRLREVDGPDWKTVKEAVERLIRIAEILLTVLHKKDEGFDQFVEIARRTAKDFWEGQTSFVQSAEI